ncbi:MAG: ABC transporter ATP-binding protein [Oscillospiraceae bacterium]|nr:ABC transporter ATP-binding protein [Oscillospiraceae bacterium]
MAIIEIKDLRKTYKLGNERVHALKRINLTIEKGEICCVLGTSGSGKSTLLNMLAGLEKPTKGSVFIKGTEITKLSEKKLARFRQENLGFIFQSYNLLNQLTALENVAMPLMFKGMPRKRREKIAAKMLKSVSLDNRMKHKPSQMSGGQQQRVGIARAFVTKPSVIFADEPTGNLDSHTTEDVMKLMVEMCRKYNLTLVLVTHDLGISEYADKIVHIIDGEITSVEKNISKYDLEKVKVKIGERIEINEK